MPKIPLAVWHSVGWDLAHASDERRRRPVRAQRRVVPAAKDGQEGGAERGGGFPASWLPAGGGDVWTWLQPPAGAAVGPVRSALLD